MRYQGGKTRISARIAEVVSRDIRERERERVTA